MSNGGTVVEFTAGMKVGPDERYEIVRICGRGGMGVVYEAVDHCLDRPRKVALKQLSKVFSQDPRSVKSIRQEAGNARELRHQSIMGVFDYVSWRDEHLVIMEWISGKTLAQDLFDQPNNRYSPDQALKLLKPIAILKSSSTMFEARRIKLQEQGVTVVQTMMDPCLFIPLFNTRPTSLDISQSCCTLPV